MNDSSYSLKIGIYLPNLEGGGAERAFLELSYLLSKMGVSVDIIIARKIGPYVTEIPDCVRVVELMASRKFSIVIRLIGYLKRERPDVLLAGGDVSNAIAIISCLIAGLRDRCVVSQRSVLRRAWQVQRPKTYWLWLLVLKALYKRARYVISNSQNAYEELVQSFGINRESCTVIYNSVDSDRIENLSESVLDDPWFSQSSLPVVISIGSLTEMKDMSNLIRAFSIVRQEYICNLLILGEGPERNRLIDLIDSMELNDSVRLPGFVSNPFPMLKRSRVFVSSSKVEGCPNVVQQALACSTPIVATDCEGASAELLEFGKWGRLVPVGDPERMAAAIVAVLNDPKPPDGRIRAADFSPESTVLAYLKILLPDLDLGSTELRESS